MHVLCIGSDNGSCILCAVFSVPKDYIYIEPVAL